MYTVVKRLHFCYGHRLLDYHGKCAHPHGHNAIADIELGGEQLDDTGMLNDFGEVTRLIGEYIERELDHKMLLREDDPITEVLLELGEPVFTMNVNPTAENIARLIYEFSKAQTLPVIGVRLWETADAFAEYRP